LRRAPPDAPEPPPPGRLVTSGSRPRSTALLDDDPFLPALAFFGGVALVSFAAGWFSQALLGAF